MGAGVALLGFLATIVAIINISTWFVLETVTRSFQEELGLRLSAVAQGAVSTVTPELLLEPDVREDTFVRRSLAEIAERHELRGIALFDREGRVLYSLEATSARGEQAPPSAPPVDASPMSIPARIISAEPAAFAHALEGTAASTETLDLDRELLKGAYAPVPAWDGAPGAVLGVWAGSEFLSRVPTLRKTLVGVGAGSAAVVLLTGFLFSGLLRRLSHTEVALARSENLASMGLLAAGVAHEIRNPLAIIAASAARLRRKSAPQEEGLLDSIGEEVQRMNSILEGYLRFARDEPMKLTRCDLTPVVERVVDRARASFAESGVQISLRGFDHSCWVEADTDRLQQVVLNLLLNAAQAMPSGGSVTMSLAPREDSVILTVADQGPGFSAQVLRNPFQPFQTTKETGSGLGLTIARKIVEGHRGRIEISNRVEGGAEVRLILPKSPSSSA